MSKDISPVAFISGASGGIGQEISLRLASLGYDLVLHYFNNVQAVEQLKRRIEKEFKQSCQLVQADFNDSTSTVDKIKMLNIEPEVVIHNAGKSMTGLFQDISEAELSSQMSIGLTTPTLLTKLFLPVMLSKKKGRIIMITSIWGITGASCEVTYSMIKGAQNSFVKALAKEVAQSGLQVNGIAPGAIETDMLAEYTKEELDDLRENIPAGRLGKPSEVAGLAAFLLSDDAAYINGQVLSVNGAWYC
ncbi:elongation factor P 5-aminopentanone reductase [Salipaludibacillus daqingensis]|uniref:elongation factor P 5-aminopentanone reductase n=1 Tax=Salipaludibacillus daqingensis TaxID=3041001 RepID=UPI0024772426|nr:SDR family oxidoreductase [Salipaludibacillus daqingensis]